MLIISSEETVVVMRVCTHALSLGSLGCVFYENQCQSVQENTIHVAGAGFSRIYCRRWDGCSADRELIVGGAPDP